MSSEVYYNRVLLSDIGFMRKHDTERNAMYRDGSGLKFQIEELIALGAVEIVMETYNITEKFIKSLPASIKKRASLIDKKHKCLKRAQSLIAPVANELSLEIPFGNAGYVGYGSKTPDALGRAATTVYFNIHPFLLGIEHKLQVDIDLEGIKSSIKLLREKLRSPEARATIAELEGIFGTYEHNSVESIAIRSDAPKERVLLFEEFVEDEEYLRLSEEYYRLGLPDYMKRAVTLIGRFARKVIAKPAFKETANLSAKVVTAATKIPMPNSEMWDTLLKQEYLPPIVSLRDAIYKARKMWETTKPPPVLPPGFDRKV